MMHYIKVHEMDMTEPKSDPVTGSLGNMQPFKLGTPLSQNLRNYISVEYIFYGFNQNFLTAKLHTEK